MALLAAVKRSEPYRRVRRRVTRACPTDSWYEEETAFVTFELRPPSGSGTRYEGELAAHAIFAVAARSGVVLAARVLEPSGRGQLDVRDIMGAGDVEDAPAQRTGAQGRTRWLGD